MKLTIEEKIALLDDTFRGLWKSYTLNETNELISKLWTVTFVYKGQYCETPDVATPHEALDFAIKKVMDGVNAKR